MWLIINFLLFLVFFYLVWRKNRIDYDEKKIIWLLIVDFLIFNLVIKLKISLAGLSYLLGYGCAVGFGFWLVQKRWKWKYWMFLENVYEIWWGFVLINLIVKWWIVGRDLVWFNWWFLWFLSGIITLMSKNKYRSYGWYKSGKAGFVFFYGNVISSLFLLLSTFWLGLDWKLIVGFGIWNLLSLIGLVMLGEVFGSIKFLGGGKQ